MGESDVTIIDEIIRRHKETGLSIREVAMSGYMMKFRMEIDRCRNQAMLAAFLAEAGEHREAN